MFDWGDGTNLTVSADSFEGNQSLTLTTGVNEGTSNRSKDIAIVSTDGSVTSVIQFTQLASAYSYVFNLQPAGSVNFAAEGGSVSVGNTLQIYQNGELLRSEENVDCEYTLSPPSPLSLSTESGVCTVTAPSLGLSLSPAGTYTLTGSFVSEETGELVSAELILTQEANLIEAITVTSEDVSLNYAEIPAGGGSSSPQLSSEPAVSVLFTSGDSGAPASITIPDGSGVLTIGIQSYQMGVDAVFTMEDSVSGVVSASSRTTVMGDTLTSPVVSADYVAQWQPADADYGEPVSGDSIPLTAYVTQAANIVTGVSVDLSGGSFSLEYAEVPAAGGTATPTLNAPDDVVLSYTWASGATTSDTTPQASISYSALSYTGTSSDGFSMDDASFASTGSVVVSSRGGIIGEARQSSEVTASSVVLTVSWPSVEYAPSVQSISLGSASGVVTQAANIIESYEIMGSSWNIPATSTFSAGGSSASYTNSCTFSSGVVEEFTDVESISWSLSGDFGRLETPTLLDITDWMCTVIAASRGTVVGEALTATLTLQITGSAQESATLTLTQARNNVVSAVCCTPEGDAFDSVVGPLSASGSEFAFSTIATFTSGATAQGVLPLPSSAESSAAWLSATDTTVTVASCGSVISDERQGVLTFTSESTGGFDPVSFSLTVAQEANALLSSQLRVDPVTTVVSAAGGSVQLACKSENIYTSGADVHTDVTADCSFVVSDADGSGVTVSETGVVSFPSRGTVEGGAYTATIQASYNSDSATVEVSQEANAVTISEVTIQSGSFDSVVPAGGGTSTLTFEAQATLSYTSGSTQSVSNSEQQGLWSASAEAQDASWVSVGDVTGTGEADFIVASRGTAVGDIREASVQLTVSFSTVSGTASYTLQQAANQVASATIDITTFEYEIMAATATQSGLPSITETLTYTYSSGASAPSQDSISHAFAITPIVSGASISQEGVVSWSENEGAEARSLTVELTSTISNSGVSASDTATALLTQTAGAVTYGDVQVSLSYSDIPASGGTVQPVLSYSQTFGYNGSTTGGGVITSGGAVSYSGVSVSDDGSVSASSLGTTTQDRSEVTTVTVTVALNGQEGSTSVPVYQAANAVESYGTPVVSISYATVPASGGTATPTGSYTQTATYTSGSRASLTTGGVWSYSGGGVDSATGTLSVASLGTTVKDISSIATVTATVTMNGKSGRKQVDILQAANVATYATPEVSLSYQDIPASGGSASPTLSYSQSVSYTSGASRSITSGGSVSYSGTGVGVTTGSVSASTLGTVVKSRTQITTASVSVVLNGKTGTDAVAVYQAANAVVSYSKPVVSLSYSVIPARGGSVNPTVGCTQQATYTSGASAGVSTSEATYTYSGSGVSTSTGQVTAQSLGVTVTSEQTLITSVTVTCTLNGQSGTASAQVYQAVNSVSYSDVTVTSFTYAGIPASGGSVSPSLSYSQTATYTSGSTRSITSGGSASYSGTSVNTTSGAVSAASKGTAISNTTTVTTATVSVSLNGKSGSKSAVVQQSGNYVVGLVVNGASFSYSGIGAGATSATPTLVSADPYVVYTFTSGSTSTVHPSSTYGTFTDSVVYSLGSVVDGFTSVNSGTGVLTATSRGTTIGPARTSGIVTRKVTVTWTPASGYNAAGVRTDTDNKTAMCTQALNTITSFKYGNGAGDTPTTSFAASASSSIYYPYFTFSSGSVGLQKTYSNEVDYSISGTGFSLGSISNATYSYGQEVVVASRGTTIGPARTGTLTGTLNTTINGVAINKSAALTLTQAANTQTAVYDSPTVSLSVSDIPAAGGVVSSGTVSYSQKWRYSYTSGSVSEQTAKTTGGSVSYSTAVSASSLGTTIKSRTQVGTLTATVTMNGKSGQGSAAVYQAANAITAYSVPTGRTLSVADIPAKGGSVSSGTLGGSISQTRTYTSGSTDTLSNPTVSSSSYSTAVSAPSLGTTVKSRAQVGTLTYYYTCNGKRGSVSAVVYQAANAATTISYGSWVISVSANRYTSSASACPASGGTATITRSASRTRTQNYTSGATSALSAETATPTLSISGAGFTLSGTTVTIASRGTTIGAARTATVTATHSGVSKSITLYQALNTITSFNLVNSAAETPTTSFTAAGGQALYYPYFTWSSGSVGYFKSLSQSVTYDVTGSGFSLGAVSDAASSYGQQVVVASRGTVIGAARSGELVSSLDTTYNSVPISVSGTLTLTQALNRVESCTVLKNELSYPAIAAAGGTSNPAGAATATYNYSSGATGSPQGNTTTISYSMPATSGFSINTTSGVVTATNNTSTSSRTSGAITRTVKYSYTNPSTVGGNTISATSTKTATCTQSAGAKTYANPVVSLSYATIPAKGGTVTPTMSYSQTWGWNGATSGGGTITSGGTIRYSGTSVNTTSGAVSASSKGIAISNVTTVTTATVSVALNGKSGSKSATVQQSGNYVTSIDVVGSSFQYANISAGATSASPSVSGGSVKFTFSSGSTSTSAPASTYGAYTTVTTYALGSVVNGFTAVNSSTGVLTATSRGTSIGAARTSGVVTRTLTATWTPTSAYSAGGVKTYTGHTTATCTQALNTITSFTYVKGDGGSPRTSFAASASLAEYYPYFTFSSGSSGLQKTYSNEVDYSISGAGFSLGAKTNATYSYGQTVEAASRGTTIGAARTGTLTGTLNTTINGVAINKSATLSLTQEANTQTAVYDAPTVTLTVSDIPASGGTVSSGTVSYSQKWRYSYTSGSVSEQTAKTTGGSVSYSTAVPASSLGTTVKSRTQVGTLTTTVTMNGKSGKDSAAVYQALNTVTALTITNGGGGSPVTSVSASGDTVEIFPRFTFSSGAVSFNKSASQKGTWSGTATGFTVSTIEASSSYGRRIVAANRGTTIGAARSIVSTFTLNTTINGVAVNKSASHTLTQAANVKSYDYTDLQGHIGLTTWPARSDYTTFWATGNYVERYTSGATGASGSGSIPWDRVDIPVDWVTYSAVTGHLTWVDNTGAERSTTITGRIGSWTYPVTVKQAGGAVNGILYVRFPSNTSMGFIPQWQITVRTSAGGQLWSGTASETGQTGGAYTIRLPDEAVSAINNDTSGTIIISCTYATTGRYYTGSPTGTELDELRSGGTIYVDVSLI